MRQNFRVGDFILIKSQFVNHDQILTFLYLFVDTAQSGKMFRSEARFREIEAAYRRLNWSVNRNENGREKCVTFGKRGVSKTSDGQPGQGNNSTTTNK